MIFGTYLYFKKTLTVYSYLCLLVLVSLFYTIVLMDSQYKLKKKKVDERNISGLIQKGNK